VFLVGIASKTAREGGDGGVAIEALDANSSAIAGEIAAMFGDGTGDAYYQAWWRMTRHELAYSAARARGDTAAAQAAEAGAYAEAAETVDILVAAHPSVGRDWLTQWMNTLVLDTLLLLDIEESWETAQYDRYYWTHRKTQVLGQIVTQEYDAIWPDPLPGDPENKGAELRSHMGWLLTDNTYQTTLLTWAELGVGDAFAANKYLHANTTTLLTTVFRDAYGDTAATQWNAAWSEQIAALREYAARKKRGGDTQPVLSRVEAAEQQVVSLLVSWNGSIDAAALAEALDQRNDAIIAAADAQAAGAGWADDARAARVWAVAFSDIIVVGIYEQDPDYSPPKYTP
jgi:hypothetical protein